MRFDEVELQSVPVIEPVPSSVPLDLTSDRDDAPRFRRLLALLTDLSLFAALTLALTPLLPDAKSWQSILGLAGFVIITSYYYFAGAWLLWGKTAGGAIFDVRVVSSSGAAMSVGAASLRWVGVYFSLLTGGIGFALAALPSRLSFSDRLSGTRSVIAA
jgi:uncharacterized RDD family membrane protein YckC